MAILGLLKIKVFWNEGYNAISFVQDVTNKISLRESNYIVDMLSWDQVIKKSYHNLNFIRIWPEKPHILSGGLGSSSIVWHWYYVWTSNFTLVCQKG